MAWARSARHPGGCQPGGGAVKAHPRAAYARRGAEGGARSAGRGENPPGGSGLMGPLGLSLGWAEFGLAELHRIFFLFYLKI
jgi:hypothetical protein